MLACVRTGAPGAGAGAGAQASAAAGEAGGAGEPPADDPAAVFRPRASGGVDIWGGGGYRLVSADMRSVESLRDAVMGGGGDPSLPTLLLSECVLVYLEPEDSCAIIAWAARTFKRSVFVTYEQVGFFKRVFREGFVAACFFFLIDRSSHPAFSLPTPPFFA